MNFAYSSIGWEGINYLSTTGRSWVSGYSLAELLIAVVIIAACVALVYVALNQFGIAIPPWVVQVFWICVVAFVIIFAIRLVLHNLDVIHRSHLSFRLVLGSCPCLVHGPGCNASWVQTPER